MASTRQGSISPPTARAVRVFLAAAALAAVAAALWCRLHYPAGTDAAGRPLPVHAPAPPLAYGLSQPDGLLATIALLANAAAAGIAIASLFSRRRAETSLWPALAVLHLAVLWWLLLERAAGAPRLAHDRLWHIIQAVGSAVVSAAVLGAAALYAVRTYRNRAALVLGQSAPPLARRRAGLLPIHLAAVVVLLTGELLGPAGPWGALVEPADYIRQWLRAAASGIALLGILRYRFLRALPSGDRATHLVRSALHAAPHVATAACIAATAVAVAWYQRPVEAFHEVVPGRLYRSAQPSEAGLALQNARCGFRTIICMRTTGTPEWERRFARRHRIRLIDPTLDEWSLERFTALLADPDARPVLVHCSGGTNRTSSWVGLYRHLIEGWTLEDVYAEVERLTGRTIHPLLPVFFADTLADNHSLHGTQQQP